MWRNDYLIRHPTMRSSFVFYDSWWEAIKNLPRDVQGDVLTAIIEYGLSGETTEQLKPITKAMLAMVKPQIDVNNQRYENGKKGGRPPKDRNRSETNQKPKTNQEETKVKPNDNVNDNDKKETSSNEEEKKAWLSLEAKEQELRNLESLLKAKEEELAKREAALKAKSGGTPPNLDFVSEEFKNVFSMWLDYKRERKENYKSEKSLKIAYNQLVKLSGNNPDTAKLIVEQSIASNWKGLFALKNNNHDKPNFANYDNSKQYTKF